MKCFVLEREPAELYTSFECLEVFCSDGSLKNSHKPFRTRALVESVQDSFR
jgi:hypothetical protein